MPINRRQMIGVSVAAAASVVLPVWALDPVRRWPPVSELTDPLFVGKPDLGHLYYGASVPHYRSMPGWETEIGERLALNRSYFTPGQTTDLVTQSRGDLRRKRLPHVSVKPPGSWDDVASGRRDLWLADLFRGLAVSGGPVFLTIHHEPENDSGARGMGAKDFVAMQERAIRIGRVSAPNVTVVPVHQHWTFDPDRRDKEPAAWVVPDADVFGLDIYNPWSPTNGKEWQTFGSKVDEVAPWIASKPIAIGEYGCRSDPSQPGRAAGWLQDAFDYARTHNVVSMSYFNSSLNSPDGSWELSGDTERAFARLLKSDWVARPL